MNRLRLPLLLSMSLLAGCTTSQTDVLAPYTLANGQYLQDVVTIATDERGGAPIVTVVNTYDINEPNRARLLSHDAAFSPGLATVIAGGLAGSIPNAIATVGAAAVHKPDRDCNINQNQSQQGTSIGGTGGAGGDGGNGGTSTGLGVSSANATGGAGGTSTGGAGGAGGAGGGAASNGGAANATSGTATGTGGNASGGSGGLGGAANALAELAAENSNGGC